MMTYEMEHDSLSCPVCGKPLVVAESHDKVICSDPDCQFNHPFKAQLVLDYPMLICNRED